MFVLLAARTSGQWNGGVGREEFDTLEAAEIQMQSWARFGVDAYCNEPDLLWITDADERILKVWDWKARAPVAYRDPLEPKEDRT